MNTLGRMKTVVDPQNSVYTFAYKLLWCIVVNALFILTSIPLITIGASTTAMYSTMIKITEERKFSILKEYLLAFKENFFLSTGYWIFGLAVTFICYIDMFYFFTLDSIVGYFAFGVSTILTIICFSFLTMVFAVISKFEVTFRDAFTITLSIMKEHPFWAVVASMITIVLIGGFFVVTFILQIYLFMYLTFMLFGLDCLIKSYIYNALFKVYISD